MCQESYAASSMVTTKSLFLSFCRSFGIFMTQLISTIPRFASSIDLDSMRLLGWYGVLDPWEEITLWMGSTLRKRKFTRQHLLGFQLRDLELVPRTLMSAELDHLYREGTESQVGEKTRDDNHPPIETKLSSGKIVHLWSQIGASRDRA